MKKIVLSTAVIALGFASVPYFMGKSIEGQIEQYITQFDKTGIEVQHKIESGYLNTKAVATVKITDGMGFLKNLSKNTLDEKLANNIKVFLNDLNYREQKDLNLILNGTQIETLINVDNISSSLNVDGYISKLSKEIMYNLNKELSRNKPSKLAQKINEMLINKKFAFLLENDTLIIKDIKESVFENNKALDFNLAGFKITKKGSFLKNIDINIKDRREDITFNISDIKTNYDIQDINNYSSGFNIGNISLKEEKSYKTTQFYAENFGILINTNKKENRTDWKMTAKIDKGNFKEGLKAASLNNTMLSFVANIDSNVMERLNSINYNNKYIKEDFQHIIEDLIVNKPEVLLSAKTKGFDLDGKQLTSELEAQVNLKLEKINNFKEFQRSVNKNPQNLIAYLEGSNASIIADKMATNAAAPLLNNLKVQMQKSKKDGYSEIVVTVKKDGIYINDKKIM